MSGANTKISAAPDAGAFDPTWRIPLAKIGDPSAYSTSPATLISGQSWQLGPVSGLSGLTLVAGILSNASGGGTVTKISTASPIAGGDITNAGTISLNSGAGLHVTGGSLIADWNGGTVSALGAHLSLNTGTLDALNNWNVGTVAAIGTGLTLTSSTLWPDWQAGTVSAIGAGVTLIGGTISATGSGGTVTQIVAGSNLTGGTITGSGTIALQNSPTIAVTPTTLPIIINGGASAVSTPPTSAVAIIGGPDGASAVSVFDAYGGAAMLLGRRANGTRPSSLTGLTSGQSIITLSAMGYTSAGAYSGVSNLLAVQAAETWSATANGSRSNFNSTPNGATVGVGRMRIDQDGRILVDASGVFTNDGTNALQVNGSTTQTQVARSVTNAAAGYVGEYVPATVTSGAAVVLTTGTIANVGSIILTAGDWDINAEVYFSGNTLTTINQIQASITSTTATLNTVPGMAANDYKFGLALGTLGADPTLAMVGQRITSAGTYFATAKASFATSTLGAYGIIQARRR